MSLLGESEEHFVDQFDYQAPLSRLNDPLIIRPQQAQSLLSTKFKVLIDLSFPPLQVN